MNDERRAQWTCGQCGDSCEATGFMGDFAVDRWRRDHKEEHLIEQMTEEERREHYKREAEVMAEVSSMSENKFDVEIIPHYEWGPASYPRVAEIRYRPPNAKTAVAAVVETLREYDKTARTVPEANLAAELTIVVRAREVVTPPKKEAP